MAITHVRGSGPGSVSSQLPRELAHSDSDTVIASVTAVQDITDLASLSFTVVAYTVYVVLYVPILNSATAASVAIASITDVADLAIRNNYVSLATGQSDHLLVIERITTPGPYVRKGRVQKSGGGGATLSLGFTAAEVVEFYATERVPALP